MFGISAQTVKHSLLILAMILFASSANAQTPSTSSTPEEATPSNAAPEPVFKDYKGVRIGMSPAEVDEKLGKPKVKDEQGELFVISESELVQVVYDKDGKVSEISITYSGKDATPPTAPAVLGEEVAAATDGRIHKLVRYPAAGYWVAYSRTAGDAPVVSVTMKKLP